MLHVSFELILNTKRRKTTIRKKRNLPVVFVFEIRHFRSVKTSVLLSYVFEERGIGEFRVT